MLWPYLNEALMLASAALMATGWYVIRRYRNRALHRRLMLCSAGLGASFFVSYVLRSLVEGDTTFGGPLWLRPAYLAFLQGHVMLAAVAGIVGLVVLRWGLQSRFASHQRLAPWAASLWLAAAATGLVVFLLLYIVFPPGPTRSVWEAITR